MNRRVQPAITDASPYGSIKLYKDDVNKPLMKTFHINPPTISPLPPPSSSPRHEPIPSPAIENPIGDLKELGDFVRTPYERTFEEEGQSHAKRYKCIMTFCGKTFESDWMTNQKEAEKNSAVKLLTILPVRKVDDSLVNSKGSSHEMHFQAAVTVPDGKGGYIEFASDWMKKKLEARRDVMQKIVKHYFGDSLEAATQAMSLDGSGLRAMAMDTAPASTPPPVSHYAATPTPARPTHATNGPSRVTPFAGMNEGAYGGGREHYVYSSDDTQSRVSEYIARWQGKYLDTIKQKIGIGEGYEHHNTLNSLLTVAFIHPSFTHSEELKESVKKFLGVKWASYERLEFYGDAILGFIASKMLFEESETDGPHELTIKRQKIVREDACCSCMKKMMLDKYVIHRDILQTPSAKVLCDIYEAIIGALYYALSEDAYEVIRGLINQNREP